MEGKKKRKEGVHKQSELALNDTSMIVECKENFSWHPGLTLSPSSATSWKLTSLNCSFLFGRMEKKNMPTLDCPEIK
jgi:hypothetical protein